MTLILKDYMEQKSHISDKVSLKCLSQSGGKKETLGEASIIQWKGITFPHLDFHEYEK